MTREIPLITVLGPTAVGKTKFAVRLAKELGTDIISADSRQVYIGMNIGTGKDLSEYKIDGVNVNYHLIDIAKPGTEYNLFGFTKDFWQIYNRLIISNKSPVLCGGTGLYIDAVLRHEAYSLVEVPVNHELRSNLDCKTNEELITELKFLRKLHNTTDTTDRDRMIRAIEIELHKANHTYSPNHPLVYPSPVFGIFYDREIIRKRITHRLEERLKEGMIDEVTQLLDSGLQPGQLIFYGLEYKYITLYILGEISYNQMFALLNTAIHQFAKRQMTWFRKMEKNGIAIYWLHGSNGPDANLNEAMEVINAFTIN